MDKIHAFRADAVDKVTGRAKYGADHHTPNMLHAKILWSPVPCARILKIDTAQAEKLLGVFGIVTRKDIKGPNLTGVFGVFDHPILVGEEEQCRYIGDALALVAADSVDTAARARDLIRVEYEPLPTANSVEEARAMELEACIHRSIQKGDIAAGLAQAAVIVEHSYSIPYQDHAYIEPEGGFAFVDEHGVVTVHAGTQDIVTNQRAVCKALDYPFHMVRMQSPYVGGAFGGKHLLSVQPYLTLLAQVLQRPVHLVWTREESLAFSCKRQCTSGTIRLGLDRDGCICGIQGQIDGPSAPYLANSGDNCFGVLNGMIGPYRIPHIDLTGTMWPTTGPEMGAFRGVGAPDGVLIAEALLVEAGAKLGLSQLEVHRRNWVQRSEEFLTLVEPSLMRNDSPEWPMSKLMDTTIAAAGPAPMGRAGKRVGRGIASAKAAYATRNTDWHSGSSVQLEMFLDGAIQIKTGFTELGQGITGIATRIASREMGIPEDRINVLLGDSHMMPPAGALGFSQATVCVGNCIIKAAKQLKDLLCDHARAYLETAEPLVFHNDAFFGADGTEVLNWPAFSDYCVAQVASLSVRVRDRGAQETHSQFGITPVVCVVDVEIDEETGQVQVLQIMHGHDIGEVIHQESARGQVLGSAVMCLGSYLMEEFHMKDGHPITPSFAEYLIPTALDIPQKNSVLFYEGNRAFDCPYGAKGLGEHGMYCTAAAVSNAIFDAIGATLLKLPVTPEKVLRAMGKLS